MNKNRYLRNLRDIESEVRGFDKIFFMAYCLERISEIDNSKRGEDFNWEFVYVKAIKICGLAAQGSHRPSREECNRVINKIWMLNDNIIPHFKQGSVLNAVRVMLNQQATYQTSFEGAVADISRQLHLVATNHGLDNCFREKYQISIVAYCWIFFQIALQGAGTKTGSFEINMPALLQSSIGIVTPRELYIFFRNFSLPLELFEGFLAGFTAHDHQFSSNFFDSPFKAKPFLFTGDSIRTISTNLTLVSVSSLLSSIMKSPHFDSRELYKKHFTDEFEVYTGKLLARANVKFLDEKSIRELYRDNGISAQRNNVVDFLVVLEGTKKILLIECKGVEQNDFVKTLLDRSEFAARLKETLIKGTAQSQQCVSVLQKMERFFGYEFYSFVVCNDDYLVSSARQLEEFVGGLANYHPKILDPSPLDLQKIRYLHIGMFEDITEALYREIYRVDEFLDASQDSKYLFSLKLLHEDLCPSRVKFNLTDFIQGSKLLDKLVSLQENNKRYTATHESRVEASININRTLKSVFRSKIVAERKSTHV